MNINTIINCFNLISKETTIPNKRGFILATNNKGIDKNIQLGTIKNRILNIRASVSTVYGETLISFIGE